MKIQMFACAGLMLALTQTLGCQRTAKLSATASAPAGTTSPAVAPDPCVVALAPAAGETARDAAIARAQLDAGSPARDRAALERLGYLYVARARLSNDPGDYTARREDRRVPRVGTRTMPPRSLLRGHVLHQLHRFSEAEQIARAAGREARVRARLRPAGRRADGAGPADGGRRRVSEDDRSEAVLSVLHPRRAPALDEGRPRWRDCAMRLAIEAASPRDPESSPGHGRASPLYELQAGRLADARARGRHRAAAISRTMRRPSGARAACCSRMKQPPTRIAALQPRGAAQSASRVPMGARRRPARCRDSTTKRTAVERELTTRGAASRSAHGRAVSRDAP